MLECWALALEGSRQSFSGPSFADQAACQSFADRFLIVFPEQAARLRARMATDASLGVSLRSLRERAGLSQEALAERAGLGVATLAAIEREERQRPHLHTLAALADALGLSPDERGAFLEAARGRGTTTTTSTAGSDAQRGSVSAARGRPIGRGNLPTGLSSLVGRDRELAEVLTLLQAHRLVTLTGAGGVGKTRLALAVGARAVEASADGVWLAALGSIMDPSVVAQTVAAAVGVSERPGRSVAAVLVEALSAGPALLVLDNCEHLVEASAELVETLLHGCPELRVLATSREPLRVPGEVTRRVPSLALPPSPPPPRSNSCSSTRCDCSSNGPQRPTLSSG